MMFLVVKKASNERRAYPDVPGCNTSLWHEAVLVGFVLSNGEG